MEYHPIRQEFGGALQTPNQTDTYKYSGQKHCLKIKSLKVFVNLQARTHGARIKIIAPRRAGAQIHQAPTSREAQEAKSCEDKISEKEKIDKFRNDYPGSMRTKDGHWVRSKTEVIIDDALYYYGI